MQKLTKEEEKYFEMIHSSGIKKISINLDLKILEKIDELAGMFNISRTLVMESIINTGLPSYLNIIESMNRKLQKKKPENKKLVLMLANIQKFRKKWEIK